MFELLQDSEHCSRKALMEQKASLINIQFHVETIAAILQLH